MLKGAIRRLQECPLDGRERLKAVDLYVDNDTEDSTTLMDTDNIQLVDTLNVSGQVTVSRATYSQLNTYIQNFGEKLMANDQTSTFKSLKERWGGILPDRNITSTTYIRGPDGKQYKCSDVGEVTDVKTTPETSNITHEARCLTTDRRVIKCYAELVKSESESESVPRIRCTGLLDIEVVVDVVNEVDKRYYITDHFYVSRCNYYRHCNLWIPPQDKCGYDYILSYLYNNQIG